MSRDLARRVRVDALHARPLAHTLRAPAPLTAPLLAAGRTRRAPLALLLGVRLGTRVVGLRPLCRGLGGTRRGVEHLGHEHLDAAQDVRSADELVGVERWRRTRGERGVGGERRHEAADVRGALLGVVQTRERGRRAREGKRREGVNEERKVKRQGERKGENERGKKSEEARREKGRMTRKRGRYR